MVMRRFNRRIHTGGRDALLDHMPVPLARVRIAVIQYLVCNSCLLIVALAGICVSITIKNDAIAIKFLQVIPAFSLNTHALFQGAVLFMMFASLAGILFHFCYAWKFLCVMPCLIMAPLCLLAIGVAEGALIGIRETSTALKHLEKVEAYHFSYRHLFKRSKNSQEHLGYFQTNFHCCGVTTQKGWLLSMCNCIPMSCCRHGNEDECQKFFLLGQQQLPLGTDLEKFKEYQTVIWEKPCIEPILEKAFEVKFLWTKMSAGFAIAQLVLNVWIWHLVRIFRELLQTDEGFAQIMIFKAKWPTKKIKVKMDFVRFTRARDSLPSSDESEELYIEALADYIQKEAEEEEYYTMKYHRLSSTSATSIVDHSLSRSRLSTTLNPSKNAI